MIQKHSYRYFINKKITLLQEEGRLEERLELYCVKFKKHNCFEGRMKRTRTNLKF